MSDSDTKDVDLLGGADVTGEVDGSEKVLLGVLTIPNIVTPPDVNRDDDDDDSTLPLERMTKVPDPLIAKLITVQLSGENEHGDIFNDLGENIPRDDSNLARSNDDLVNKMNSYPNHGDSGPGVFFGGLATFFTLGIYKLCRRETVLPGNFGHIRSNGRDMFLKSGNRSLWVATDKWIDTNVPIDDEVELRRTFGTKTFLTVPQNSIGTAKRIGGSTGADGSEKAGDGDQVIFKQGRHILPEDQYSNINIEKLEGDIIRLGPLTVLYVKEGSLGGAYHRHSGQYKIFLPGPPYLLHEKDYEQIVCVRRNLGQYDVGPVHFMNVKDGEIGGAYHINTGLYQVLPPGNTYMLSSKDYEDWSVVKKADMFKLGPYYFVTVQRGYVAGAYRVKGGKFINLPQGSTYQLNEQDYREPELVPMNSHMVTCGPYTYLTIEKGTFNGATRVADGFFEEFEDEGRMYTLHREKYRDVVTVPMISDKLQAFGPYMVVTVHSGFAGVFRRRGQIEVMEPGTYKLGPEYEALMDVPLNTRTTPVDGMAFHTKDGIEMSLNANVVWRVNDPKKVTLYPHGFEQLVHDILHQTKLTLTSLCMTYNRDEILPTKQDILVKSGGDDISEEETTKLLKIAEDTKNERYERIITECQRILTSQSTSSDWGLEIVEVTLRGFRLEDEKIIRDLAEITTAILATKAQQAQSRLQIEEANTDRNVRTEKAKADAAIKMEEAEAKARVQKRLAETQAEVDKEKARTDADVAKQKAEAEAEVTKQRALAAAQAKVEEAKAKSEADVIIARKKAEAEAEARRVKLDIDNAEVRETAKTKAEAIRLMAEAEFLRESKMNEAKSLIPEHVVDLEKAKISGAVEAVKYAGAAAWRHPEPVYEAVRRVEELTGLPVWGHNGSDTTVIMDARKHTTVGALPLVQEARAAAPASRSSTRKQQRGDFFEAT